MLSLKNVENTVTRLQVSDKFLLPLTGLFELDVELLSYGFHYYLPSLNDSFKLQYLWEAGNNPL